MLDLPTGSLAFAAGVEQRGQSGRFYPDPVVAAGDTAGLPAQPTSGALDVTAVYGEIAVPLVVDAPWGDLVDLSAAVRYFDYTSFDSGVTGKVGVRWRPTSTLLLRGTWAEGYRAPKGSPICVLHTARPNSDRSAVRFCRRRASDGPRHVSRHNAAAYLVVAPTQRPQAKKKRPGRMAPGPFGINA